MVPGALNLPPQSAALYAPHDRHVHIQKDNFKRSLFQLLKRFLSVRDDRNLMAGIGQDCFEYHLVGPIVIGD